MEANDLWNVTNLDSRGMVSRIYVEDHYCYILHMLAPGLMASEEKIFEGFFSYILLYKEITLWGMGSLGPMGLSGRIYVKDH